MTIKEDTATANLSEHLSRAAARLPDKKAVVCPAGYGRVEVSHIGLNDQVVEGLRALDIPAFSVQYHPEAAAGPHDSAHLFDRFAALMGVEPRSEAAQSSTEESHGAAH